MPSSKLKISILCAEYSGTIYLHGCFWHQSKGITKTHSLNWEKPHFSYQKLLVDVWTLHPRYENYFHYTEDAMLMSEKQSLYTKLILCLQRLAGTEHLTKWMRKLGEKSYLLHSPGSSMHIDLHQTFTSWSGYFCIWKEQTGVRKSWGVWVIATNWTGENALHAKSQSRVTELICFPKNEYERIVNAVEKKWHRLVLLLFSKVLSPFRLWLWSAGWIQWQCQFQEFPPHPAPSIHSSLTLPSFSSSSSLLLPSHLHFASMTDQKAEFWTLFYQTFFPNTDHFNSPVQTASLCTVVLAGVGHLLWTEGREGREQKSQTS